MVAGITPKKGGLHPDKPEKQIAMSLGIINHCCAMPFLADQIL
jgi:hypothetical protein